MNHTISFLFNKKYIITSLAPRQKPISPDTSSPLLESSPSSHPTIQK